MGTKFRDKETEKSTDTSRADMKSSLRSCQRVDKTLHLARNHGNGGSADVATRGGSSVETERTTRGT